MFLNYLLIETKLNVGKFYEAVNKIVKDLGSTMRILQSDTQTILVFTNDKKSVLKLLLDGNHLIIHSTKIIVDSKLIVQKGLLVVKEGLIRKINLHKRIAFLNNVLVRT